MGQTEDARGIVDTLKKNVLLVADLIAAMQVRDGSGTDLLTGSQLGGGVGGVLGSLAASLLPKSLDLGQPLLNPPTSFSTPPSVPLYYHTQIPPCTRQTCPENTMRPL